MDAVTTVAVLAVGVEDGILKVRAYMPGFGDWIVRTISVADGAPSKLEGLTP